MHLLAGACLGGLFFPQFLRGLFRKGKLGHTVLPVIDELCHIALFQVFDHFVIFSLLRFIACVQHKKSHDEQAQQKKDHQTAYAFSVSIQRFSLLKTAFSACRLS